MTATVEQNQLLAQPGMSGLGCCVSAIVVASGSCATARFSPECMALAPATAPASFAPRSGRHLIGDSVTLV